MVGRCHFDQTAMGGQFVDRNNIFWRDKIKLFWPWDWVAASLGVPVHGQPIVPFQFGVFVWLACWIQLDAPFMFFVQVAAKIGVGHLYFVFDIKAGGCDSHHIGLECAAKDKHVRHHDLVRLA